MAAATRKPARINPVAGRGRWIGGTPDASALAIGTAALEISVTRHGGAVVSATYWIKRLTDAAGALRGYRLEKWGGSEVWDLDVSFGPADPRAWECDCPDAVRCGSHRHTLGLAVCKHAKFVGWELRKLNLL